jgi:catechol 2,3-dioxygenase-like lactoylglutathione lyase family enzyme
MIIKDAKLHHIGIACKDIKSTIEYYTSLFKVKYISPIIYDKNQDVYLAFLVADKNTSIEFISGKLVEKLIRKGISFYHVCYEVENLEETPNVFERIIELEGTYVKCEKCNNSWDTASDVINDDSIISQGNEES